MDLLLLFGIFLVFSALVGVVVADGNQLSALASLPSFMLVVVGSLGVATIASQLSDLKRVPGSLRILITGRRSQLEPHLNLLARMTDLARRDGVLRLEKELDSIDDPMIREGIQMIIDGFDSERMQQRFDDRLDALSIRHQSAQRFFELIGTYAPPIGLTGTIIGIVNMLGNLEDPENLGAGMALALLTTLYGSVLGYLFARPIATKLAWLHADEIRTYEAAIEGLMLVQTGASPRQLIEQMEVHLPSRLRRGYDDRREELAEALLASDESAARGDDGPR